LDCIVRFTVVAIVSIAETLTVIIKSLYHYTTEDGRLAIINKEEVSVFGSSGVSIGSPDKQRIDSTEGETDSTL
jgi:hypothetical protein